MDEVFWETQNFSLHFYWVYSVVNMTHGEDRQRNCFNVFVFALSSCSSHTVVDLAIWHWNLGYFPCIRDNGMPEIQIQQQA